jgi:hypothetical protein
MSDRSQKVGQPPQLPGIYTETLARLYATQGLYDQALTIYRQLLQWQPENQELQRKIAPLEQRVAEAMAPGRAAGEPQSASRKRLCRKPRRSPQVVAQLECWLDRLRQQRKF